MTIRQLELEVMRYDPEKDKEPYFQEYSVRLRLVHSRCVQLRKVKHGHDSELPLVLPHDGLRQLRHDDQW